MHEGKLFVRTVRGFVTFPEFLTQQGPVEKERALYISPELIRELHSEASLKDSPTNKPFRQPYLSHTLSEVPTKQKAGKF
jgi:hypothetical protein